MSREKANTMAALVSAARRGHPHIAECGLPSQGAEIIRTPTEAAHDSPLSNMGKARELLQSIPHAVMLDQYGNPDSEPRAFPPAVQSADRFLQTPTHTFTALEARLSRISRFRLPVPRPSAATSLSPVLGRAARSLESHGA